LTGSIPVITGGAAIASGADRAFACAWHYAWGVTETNPAGLAYAPKSRDHTLAAVASAAEFGAKQGRPISGMQFSICHDDREFAQDGVAAGSLLVRGPCGGGRLIPSGPDLRVPARAGRFDTGNVVTMDTGAYVQIVDRSKQVIKSGCEWRPDVHSADSAKSV
jgi:3-(methylthio)propionyl---CoA ligase